MTALREPWVTTRLAPEGVEMEADPAVTVPPVGSDCANAGPAIPGNTAHVARSRIRSSDALRAEWLAGLVIWTTPFVWHGEYSASVPA